LANDADSEGKAYLAQRQSIARNTVASAGGCWLVAAADLLPLSDGQMGGTDVRSVERPARLSMSLRGTQLAKYAMLCASVTVSPEGSTAILSMTLWTLSRTWPSPISLVGQPA
jgi:hypothetical protein